MFVKVQNIKLLKLPSLLFVIGYRWIFIVNTKHVDIHDLKSGGSDLNRKSSINLIGSALEEWLAIIVIYDQAKHPRDCGWILSSVFPALEMQAGVFFL